MSWLLWFEAGFVGGCLEEVELFRRVSCSHSLHLVGKYANITLTPQRREHGWDQVCFLSLDHVYVRVATSKIIPEIRASKYPNHFEEP